MSSFSYIEPPDEKSNKSGKLDGRYDGVDINKNESIFNMNTKFNFLKVNSADSFLNVLDNSWMQGNLNIHHDVLIEDKNTDDITLFDIEEELEDMTSSKFNIDYKNIPQNNVLQNNISQNNISQNNISQNNLSQNNISQNSISQNNLFKKKEEILSKLIPSPNGNVKLKSMTKNQNELLDTDKLDKWQLKKRSLFAEYFAPSFEIESDNEVESDDETNILDKSMEDLLSGISDGDVLHHSAYTPSWAS